MMKAPLFRGCVLFFGLNVVLSHMAYDERCLVSQRVMKYTGCPTQTWQYNARIRKCVQSCVPSGPFRSKDECDGICRSSDVCKAPRPLSSCESGTEHLVFFYNPKNKTCVQGRQCTYAGNNFPTMMECQQTCAKHRLWPLIPSRCRVYPSHGYYCLWGWRSGSARYYYDPYAGRCIGFWYYGCGGTRNNFATLDECQRRCAGRQGVIPVYPVGTDAGIVFST